MPSMPRPKGKATKIAFHIMGPPQNSDKKRNTKREKELEQEETRMVK